ncbi:MAG TPA: penicillin-binding protein activator [Kofleriaceae bacterium]|nr:penicillin-binding protein activator [Kofleriaceae bacterium]
MRGWAAVAAATVVMACGGRPPRATDWIDRDDPRAHATRQAPAPASADAPVVAAGDPARLARHLEDLAAQAVAPHVDGKLIAVLLPLSGSFAGLGGELRAAIELAPASGTRWLFLDTHGTPDGAAAAVDQAHARGAIAVLGPVGQREAIAAARAATLHGLPIALLAPGDGGDAAAGVFRVVDSPADEARAVAALAARDSYPTVGVLAPRDDVGRDASEAFVAEATRLGLRVTAQGTYDPTGGDVEPELKRFLGLVPAQNPRLAAHLARHGKAGWTTFSPDIPYTLLYIPDRYDRAALVASFLPYYNVELRTTDNPDPERLARKHGGHVPQIVQLVGGAGWHHPTLPVRGGAAVQGALIVDDFAGELGGEPAQQLVAAFQARTRRVPTTAAAQAYDAAWLVATARAEVSGASPDPRKAMRAALAHAHLVDGACGEAAIGPDGELARVPSVLEVQGDELVLVP